MDINWMISGNSFLPHFILSIRIYLHRLLEYFLKFLEGHGLANLCQKYQRIWLTKEQLHYMLSANYFCCSELRKTNLPLDLGVSSIYCLIVEILGVYAVIYSMHFISFYINGIAQIDLLLEKLVHLLARQGVFCWDWKDLGLERVLKFTDPIIIHIFVTNVAENDCFCILSSKMF